MTTSCDRWECQQTEEAESETRFAASFEGVACYVWRFSVATPNLKLGIVVILEPFFFIRVIAFKLT